MKDLAGLNAPNTGFPGFLYSHAAILVAVIILVMLWKIGGAVLWHLLDALLIGIVIKNVPALYTPRGGTSVTRTGGTNVITQAVSYSSEGISLLTSGVLAVLLAGTLILVLRHRRTAARENPA
jgi:hypothetical protein